MKLLLNEVCPPSLLKPQPATSFLFEPPPQLMLIDTEDEENEYVQYTGKTIRACDLLKSERPRLLEAEMNPRMPAWLNSDSEVLEEVWASEVVEHHVNVQKEPKSKRKVPLVLFIWTEEKAKKKEEKKIQKEKERRDKVLLLERYRNNPKLKHLLINNHNHHHYRSSEGRSLSFPKTSSSPLTHCTILCTNKKNCAK
ncbi:putative manganese-dependent inorganic pyrophosphatase [Labeo rohita]|uniref:Manganese-dependent inorganic pyrophosphatase n=1 Tax=Labeo rohita TaxID=84645 RepID=A0ABQ8L407_LABRO|nr:putative manganese-dependent inorganic pyrophosphatase [Labeo rohita]